MYGYAAVEITQYASQSFHSGRNFRVVIIHMVRAVVAILMFLASFAAGLWLATTLARADATPLPIVGQWTLNKELSDLPSSSDQRGDASGNDDHDRGRGYGGGHRGGGGGGGYGHGYGGGRSDGGRSEDAARRVQAIREIMTGADRLTITATDSMVIVTDAKGRTTRLSLDGKKIKDDSTGIERKTKWDGAKLVTEISGAGPGTITQTYQIDPEHHQLTITVQPPAKTGAPMPRRFVYDTDAH
jgi:hypothetical protein